jgi:hypothetical protein
MRRWKVRPEGSNWGDFGDDDQIGRLNLLTPERRMAGVREVRDGRVFTLSLPLDYPGGSVVSGNRKPPKLMAGTLASGGLNYFHSFRAISPLFCDICNDDAVLLHTQYSTQWDSLAHHGTEFDLDGDGQPERAFYNGYSSEDFIAPNAEGGPYAKKLGIENLATAGVQGRGVLVNLHAVYGRERRRVGYDDFMRILDQQKVEVKTGDFLCLYTGYADLLLEMNKQPDGKVLRSSCVGLDGTDDKLLQWITDSGVVSICADNVAVEYVSNKPRMAGAHSMMPLHDHCLFKLGLNLGEMWYFTELANYLAGHKRSAFLLTAPPLRLPGAVGSPVTPIATV